MDNIIKGYAYEKFILDSLKPLPDDIWLWKDIPRRRELHLVSAGLIHDKNYYKLIRQINKNSKRNPLIGIGIDIVQ